MEITNKDVKVLGRVVAVTTDNVAVSAEQVYDESFNGGTHQDVINNHFSTVGTNLDKKIDTLQQYVDDNYVPLDGCYMNENASLTFAYDDAHTSINNNGLVVTDENNKDTTKIEPASVVFNNNLCGIELRNTDIVVFNSINTLKIKRNEQLCDANGLTIQAKNFVIPGRQDGDLIGATGSVATKITEEQILNLFEQ